MIRARLMPPGDASLLIHELAVMGCENPRETQAHTTSWVAVKLIDVPPDIAALLQHGLRDRQTDAWWHRAPGASASTVDLLIAGRHTLMAELSQVAQQTPALRPVVTVLEHAEVLQQSPPAYLRLGDTRLTLEQRAYVMGILNVTPDSFSDGGLYLQPDQAVKHAEEMLQEGADIIDVGGQSSRPGAVPVPVEVERQRVVPVVQEIVKRYDVPVSVDTYRASIAEAAIDAGAVLINDISAMRFDTGMAPLLARSHAAVVLMHMQGTPQTMQQAPTYRQVVDEVHRFLAERLDFAVQQGIARERIILDPGFGFGKTVQHNLELLRGLPSFQVLGQPLLVGTSRKSFLGQQLQREVWDRLEGTITSVVYAILHGATVVRVHDVKPVVQVTRLINALAQPDGNL